MSAEGTKTQLELLEKRIKYDNEMGNTREYKEYLIQLLEDAKCIALERLYPFEDISAKELPKGYYNWQLRACEEMHKMARFNGIKSYSENGLSFSRENDGSIPLSMINELVPYAGIPLKGENNV